MIQLKRFSLINRGEHLPILALQLNTSSYTVFDISAKLREKGWIVSAYTLPANAEHIPILRIVVRENFSHDMADLLYSRIEEICLSFEKHLPKQTHSHLSIC